MYQFFIGERKLLTKRLNDSIKSVDFYQFPALFFWGKLALILLFINLIWAH